MREPTVEKFWMTWLKLYFYKGRGVAVKLFARWLEKMLFLQSSRGFYKINWVWAGLYINFDKVRGFFCKIVEPLYINFDKVQGFFVKLPSLLDNPSHPRAIRRPRFLSLRGSMGGVFEDAEILREKRTCTGFRWKDPPTETALRFFLKKNAGPKWIRDHILRLNKTCCKIHG